MGNLKIILAKNTRDTYQTKMEEVLMKEGYSGDALIQKVKEKMGKLAALHNPDMKAGGADIFNMTDLSKSIGSLRINSSIGASWSKRVGKIDKAACEAQKDGKGDKKMNVKLERCP